MELATEEDAAIETVAATVVNSGNTETPKGSCTDEWI